MDAVCKLISKTMTTDETGFPIATETEYETYCMVDSISRAEFFDAGKAGFTPEYKFTVNVVEYSGQSEIEYEGERYAIYRTYKTKEDMMELYAEYRSGVTDRGETDVDNDQAGTTTEHNTADTP